LALARAALWLDLGDPLRAAAAVARMPYTAGAMLPLVVFEALDATLERARPRLRADHAASWFSLAAHHRAYDHARALAEVVTDRELRTWKEMLRVVQVLLCTGRTHLDTCLPPDFWPRLKSQNLSGPFMDATCVLGELFWRKRYLSDEEIRQRHDFALDCFARWDRPQSVWYERIEQLAKLITYRAALHVGVPSSVLASARAGDGAASPETLRSFIGRHRPPAYVAAAPMFAEAAMGYVRVRRSFDRSDRFFAVALAGTTGQPEDLAVTTIATVMYLSTKGLRLVLSGVLDDVLLAVPRKTNPADRHELGRYLRTTAGGRAMLVGTNALFLEHGRTDVPGRDASDENSAADALMSAGDLAGAADLLKVGLSRGPTFAPLVGMLLTSHIVVSRKSLDMDQLASTTALIDRHRSALTRDILEYVSSFLKGSRALCSGEFNSAHRHFLAAKDAVPRTFEWMHYFRGLAIRNGCAARRASRIIDLWSSGDPGSSVWSAIRGFCVGLDWRQAGPSLRARAALCLEYLCWIVNAWSKVARDDDELLRVAFFLKEPVDAVFRPLGREFLGLMADWAPNFYERLRLAVRERVGDIDIAGPGTRALSAALRTIDETWKSGHMVSSDDRCERVLIRERGSRARQAQKVNTAWYDDAAAYARLWDEGGGVRAEGLSTVAYGYVGRSKAKPVATVLTFRMAPRDNGVFEVDVSAGAAPVRAESATRRDPSPAFLGQSAAAKKVRAMIDAAAKCGYPTLVLGETGVGKDLAARCVHSASAWRRRTMVVAECAGLAESLLESELFGHEKGAFTGAHESYGGFFERANGSSLLLDEVDSMSARMQAALLRVLETGEYRPIGAPSVRKSEFRLISAALPRLATMVEGGEFRRDLFYRISTLRIEIPPLRDREGDSREIAVAHARSLGFQLTSGALRAVEKYQWPGNVRQLLHCIQAAGIHATDRRIGEAAIGDVIGAYGGTPAGASVDEARGLQAAWGRALSTLERKAGFGAWDFAKAAELSRRSAQRHIAQLLRDGRIARVGAGRTTRYRVRT
jgi:transcriptional regulator with AAA-type ATPase domain